MSCCTSPDGTTRVCRADEHLRSLLEEVEELRAHCVKTEHEFRHALAEVRPSHRASARNLVHYVALRRLDLRSIQEDLARLGLSSLGRSEAHVMGSLDAVISVLRCLNGGGCPSRLPASVEAHSLSLERNADRLLGPLASDRATRIMVTMPSDAADRPDVAAELVRAGMDIARINCAHDTPAAWRAMAEHIHAAATAQGRACRIAMDLAGPKLRTGPLPLGPRVVRIAPDRDRRGVVLTPARVWLQNGSSKESAQPGVTEVPVVPEGALSCCHAGDVIRLRDARNARRRLFVVEVRPNGALVDVGKTTYFEAGLELELPAEGARVAATIGSLPRLKTAVRIRVGDELILTRLPDEPESVAAGDLRVSCTLPEVFDHARVGHRVVFDDGKLGAVVTECGADELALEVVDARPGGARLQGAKGINLPDTELPIPALTAQDEADLATAVELADIIDVSFVRSAADVELVQERVAALGVDEVGLVLKIETVAGFERLPDVLLAAMRSERIGVMIARGDLAVEAGYERMAEVQEEILWLCEAAHVPVIWATQVLDQLARTGRPSRAEVTDAALGARAECIMLNKGPYIVAAIATLLDINRRMRDHQHKKQSLLRRLRAWDHDLGAVERR
ncbi:MAG: pyruvate kinase [Acidimicrobiia bacterium]